MEHKLIVEGYIPFDKSWMIRVGVLDLVNGYDDTINYLTRNSEKLSDDLQALLRASNQWDLGESIDVGESGTLYRFLRFASWKLQKNCKFILQKTLKERQICTNKDIINYSLEDLLKLDHRTSQWASAAVLLGNYEKVEDPPIKLQLTYKAVNHWKQQRQQGKRWRPLYDKAILKHARTFLKILKGKNPSFALEHSEDYCFARAFDFITSKEAAELWPSLRGHETDRIEEMDRVIISASEGKEIDSKDHRVVYSAAMLQKVKGYPIKIKHPKVVNKSWPQFRRFLFDIDSL